MQILIDESLDDGDFISCVGEVSFTHDATGHIYLSWEREGITTEIGINLVDLLKFIQETMTEGA